MLQISKLTDDGKLNAEISTAVLSVLNAEALVGTIKPISDKIFRKAINKFKPVVEMKHYNSSIRLCNDAGQPIVSADDLFKTDDDTANKIFSYHKAQLELEGFVVKGDHCPYLIAKVALTDAQNELINKMEPFSGISLKSLARKELRERYLSLTLNCLVKLLDI